MALLAFDLNGTLLDPSGADERLARALPMAVQLAMAHDLNDDFRPLAELLRVIDAELDPRVATTMPAFADVPEGLDRLGAAGHTLAVVTNSARDATEQGLANAGIRDRFAHVVSVEDARVHKPHPRAYAFAAEQLGASPDLFVAAHAWDTLGARHAGFRTALLDRGPGAEADVRASKLAGVADALAG